MPRSNKSIENYFTVFPGSNDATVSYLLEGGRDRRYTILVEEQASCCALVPLLMVPIRECPASAINTLIEHDRVLYTSV